MKINENFVFRNIKDAYFLVPFQKNDISEEVIFLNQVGGMIFKTAPKCSSSEILTQNVAEIFHVTHDKDAIASIRSFVDQMIESGLIIGE